MATLAEAAVEIIAELDKFEPDLRRKLKAAVQSAADEAEKEFAKAGDKAGRSFADSTAKAVGVTAADPRFNAAGQIAGSQFSSGFIQRNGVALKQTQQQFVQAGTTAGRGFSQAVDKAASNTKVLDKLQADIERLEQAIVKGADAQADAAGKVRVAEARLAQVMANKNRTTLQVTEAEESLAAAQRRSAAAANTATVATKALDAARASLVEASAKAGDESGDAFGDALQKAATKSSTKAGNDSGGFFARAFETAAGRAIGSGLLKIFAGGLASVVTAASPLGTILGGVAAGLVAVTGAILQASGSAIAFAGVLGSIGLAAATVKIATGGLDDAFKAQAKALQELAADGKVSEKTQKDLAAAMKQLAPAAREVVTAVFDQAGAWRQLRTTLQQNLFAGIGASIRQLATTFLPILTTQLGTTASLLNRTARSFVEFITSSAQSSRITRILQGLNGILAALLPSLVPLAAGFLTLFEASLPFALQLAQALSTLATNFAAFATAAVESGDFAEFMRGAFEAAKLLLGIMGSLGGILSSIFDAGSESGVGLLSVIDDLLNNLQAFLESAEGQEALGSFFSLIGAAGSALIAIFSTLSPLVAGIATVFRALEGPITALGAALQPVIAQLAITLGGALETLAPQLAALVTGLTPLVGAIGAGLVAIFQALLTAVLPLVPAIVTLATTLAAQFVPILGQLVPVVLTAVEAFGQILLAVLPLIPALLPLVVAAGQLSLSFAQLLVSLAPLITLFAQLAVVTIGQTAPAIVFVAQQITGLVQSFASLISGVARVIAVIVDFVVQFISKFTELRAQGASIVQALAGAVLATFGGMIAGVIGFLRSMVAQGLAVLSGFHAAAVDRAGQIASGILGAIRSGLSGLAGVFRAPFDSARGAVASALSGILGVVTEFIGKISGAVSRISSLISNIPRPNLGGLNLPFLAKGGLTRGPSIAGEAGPEVVIPLTKPKRRDELLEKYFGGWADAKAWNGGAGYGGKTKEIHMPINVVGLSKDETVQVLHGLVEQRIGSAIGITTSVGTI